MTTVDDRGRARGEPGQWCCHEALLDESVCDALLACALTFESKLAAAVGEPDASSVRACKLRRIPFRNETLFLYEQISALALQLNSQWHQLDLTSIVKEPEFVTYEPGLGHFDWHNDLGLERPTSSRKLTVSIQLSHGTDYDGGDFEVFGEVDGLSRRRGSVVVLPSFVHHRVTPVTSGTRHALLAWIAGPALR